jgi:hypothetical protein
MIPRSRNLLATGLAATLAVTLPRRFAFAGRDLFKLVRTGRARLQLTVDAPPHWRRFLADDLAAAFASRVVDVFRRQGFSGDVSLVPSGKADQNVPALVLRLINWRLNRINSAECTFTAAVLTDRSEENLGMFENTGLSWNSRVGRRDMAEALGTAADGALRNLAVRLTQGGSVPGFPARNKTM